MSRSEDARSGRGDRPLAAGASQPWTPSRRDVLAAAGAASLVGLLPSPVLGRVSAPRASADGRRLVLVFLDGGNDGLNTVVPHRDDRYHRARPRLALGGDDLLALDDDTALHPALAAWAALRDSGRLSVLRDVGYERPDRSHFVSRDIWHSGRRAPGGHPVGWVGRALDGASPAQLPAVALGADEAPVILRGARRTGLTLHDLEGFRLDDPTLPASGAPVRGAMASADAMSTAGAAVDLSARIARVAEQSYGVSARMEEMLARIPAGTGYPPSALSERLALAARLVRAEDGPPVLWTALGGFDTHSIQPGTHAALLTQLGGATAAFLDDLARDGSDARTLVLVYSEFGRRVRENGSGGTDHGAAGPVFALGGPVRGGLVGAAPDLDDLLDGDVRPRLDFRDVFAEAARWMGWSPEPLFDRRPEKVGYLA